MLCISIYLTITVPALRAIVDPLEGADTHEDRIEAMRILSAGNVLIMVGLGAILVLQVGPLVNFSCVTLHVYQAGQEYARRTEANTLARYEVEDAKRAISVEKRDQ